MKMDFEAIAQRGRLKSSPPSSPPVTMTFRI